MDIKQKLRSQIGDDVQHIFDHEALFKLALAEIERLEAELKSPLDHIDPYECSYQDNYY